MLKKAMAVTAGGSAKSSLAVLMVTCRRSTNVSSALNILLLRSLKEHYLEISRMTSPSVSPPSPFCTIKGALDSCRLVLTRNYGKEEVNVSVMRLANIFPGGGGDDGDDEINLLFLHVSVSKPEQRENLHFLCGLYPDALGIHSVSMRPKVESSGFVVVRSGYNGPVLEVNFGSNEKEIECLEHFYQGKEYGKLLRAQYHYCHSNDTRGQSWFKCKRNRILGAFLSREGICSSAGTSSSFFNWQPSSGPSFSSGFSSTPTGGFSFGLSSSSAASNSAPMLFGSSSTSGSTTSMFSLTSAATAASPQPAFGNSNHSFTFGSTPPANNDQANMEYSMAEDTVQTVTPPTRSFGQQPLTPPPSSGFMFGSTTPSPPASNPFQFGSQQNVPTQQNPSPFQPFGSLYFDASAGGSFTLGDGGVGKSNRKFVKVKGKSRKK